MCPPRVQEKRGAERPPRRPPRSLHGAGHPAGHGQPGPAEQSSGKQNQQDPSGSIFTDWIVALTVIPLLQPPHYASSASVYQPEMGSPAPAIDSHPGVTSKVSAWLQQTHDIDATSNGESQQSEQSFPPLVLQNVV